MSFIFPLIGAVVGAAGGFTLGEMVRAGYGGAVFDMRLPILLVGAVLGYFVGRLIAGKSSHNEE